MLSTYSFAFTALLSVIAWGASVPSTNEVPAEIQARADQALAVGLIWTGAVTKGGPNITLTGDVQSIMRQILILNPNYAPEDSAKALGLITRSTALSEASLSKRQTTFSCHGLEAAVTSDVDAAINYLANLGGYCGAAAGTCARMTCSNDSGTFICSENGNGPSMTCYDAAVILYTIRSKCACSNNLVFGNAYLPGVSLWMGLARCWRGGDERPTDNPYGTQPNHGPKNC
ncbi:hypothetical protein B0J11DRAFT_510927 [Dendryphion nanum]|uniref:Uncharacterized protein n=1 Tax=Dendryphion nanum TaxID=256645 RepID=A0A9P9DAD4_9PLEO|nr:hypothetical protein B0J11DRAFT_510927 [Dendryphion nanum]